jgi:hypothetical protein
METLMRIALLATSVGLFFVGCYLLDPQTWADVAAMFLFDFSGAAAAFWVRERR